MRQLDLRFTGDLVEYDTLDVDALIDIITAFKMRYGDRATHIILGERAETDLTECFKKRFYPDLYPGLPLLNTFYGLRLVAITTLPAKTLMIGTFR